MAYPFGVLGMILAVFAARRLWRPHDPERAGDDELVNLTVRVTQPAVAGRTVAAIMREQGGPSCSRGFAEAKRRSFRAATSFYDRATYWSWSGGSETRKASSGRSGSGRRRTCRSTDPSSTCDECSCRHRSRSASGSVTSGSSSASAPSSRASAAAMSTGLLARHGARARDGPASPCVVPCERSRWEGRVEGGAAGRGWPAGPPRRPASRGDRPPRSQKGVDVLAHALDTVLAWHVQMVVMGSGDPEAEAFFLSRARTRGDRLRAWNPFDDARSHRIQAAADFFVMPSRVPRGRPGRQRAQLRPGEASHRLERRPAPFDADGVTIATCPADVVLRG